MDDMWEAIPIFAGLNDAALALLRTETGEHFFADGETILCEGSAGDRMFLVFSGGVRVIKRRPTGEGKALAELGAHDFFGEMCILETLPRSATVIARGDCVLHSLRAATFHRLYKSDPAQHGILLVNLARDLSRRLRRMDERFAALQ